MRLFYFAFASYFGYLQNKESNIANTDEEMLNLMRELESQPVKIKDNAKK